jgi:deoxyribodipyrimidine photo-lyase
MVPFYAFAGALPPMQTGQGRGWYPCAACFPSLERVMAITSLVWFRRDLRCTDHTALYHALRSSDKVYCAFVFDTDILHRFQNSMDRRVAFIYESLCLLEASLDDLAKRAGSKGCRLIIRHGSAVEAIPCLAQAIGANAVYAHRDYEPEALRRDHAVKVALEEMGCAFVELKDQVVFDRDEIMTQEGRPFSVFTPYRKAWQSALRPSDLPEYDCTFYGKALSILEGESRWPRLDEMGFEPMNLTAMGLAPGEAGARMRLTDFAQRLSRYHLCRDFPGQKGVSYLSVDLRFGTVSIRELVRLAGGLRERSPGEESWLNELVWREFYQMLLWHHPWLCERDFQKKTRNLVWDNNEAFFNAWCQGLTGYPIVDAGMRQLVQTGYMHNRLRMITASFLVKDLGIDWRWGERFFAAHLNDYDLASNNGGWQWCASTGCDAQPYFRIFNPQRQSQTFDPEGRFIRRYVPELAMLSNGAIHAPSNTKEIQLTPFRQGKDYPLPIVDHAKARQETLLRYKKAAEKSQRED